MELFRVEGLFKGLEIKRGSFREESFIHEFFNLCNIYGYHYVPDVMLGLGYRVALVKDVIFF